MSLGAEAWWAAMLGADQFEDGSLVIEDDTLDVTGGSTVNLRVKLGARPRSDVTVTASKSSALIASVGGPRTFTQADWDTYQSVVVTGAGNSQSFNATGADASAQSAGWGRLAWPQTQVIAGLLVSATDVRYPRNFSVRASGQLVLQFSTVYRIISDQQGEDLSAAFEDNGQVKVVHGGTTYTFTGPNASTNAEQDTGEVYNWTEASTANALALFNAISANDAAAITFRDFAAGDAVVSLSASGPSEYSGVTGSATVSVG